MYDFIIVLQLKDYSQVFKCEKLVNYKDMIGFMILNTYRIHKM